MPCHARPARTGGPRARARDSLPFLQACAELLTRRAERVALRHHRSGCCRLRGGCVPRGRCETRRGGRCRRSGGPVPRRARGRGEREQHGDRHQPRHHRLALAFGAPRCSCPFSVCSAWGFCFDVYFDLSPRGIRVSFRSQGKARSVPYASAVDPECAKRAIRRPFRRRWHRGAGANGAR